MTCVALARNSRPSPGARIEPVALHRLGPDLLQIAGRRLLDRGPPISCRPEIPDAIDLLVAFASSSGQRIAVAGDDVHDTVRNIRRLQHLVEIRRRERDSGSTACTTTRLPVPRSPARRPTRSRAGRAARDRRCRGCRPARSWRARRRGSAADARHPRTCRRRRRRRTAATPRPRPRAPLSCLPLAGHRRQAVGEFRTRAPRDSRRCSRGSARGCARWRRAPGGGLARRLDRIADILAVALADLADQRAPSGVTTGRE